MNKVWKYLNKSKKELLAELNQIQDSYDSLRKSFNELLETKSQHQGNYDVTQLAQHNNGSSETKKSAKENETRLKLAVDTVKLGIWDINLRDNTEVWNERMFELYEVNKETLPSYADIWESRLHPDDKQEVIHQIKSAISSKRKFKYKFRVLHSDNRIIYIEAKGVVIRDMNDQPIRMIGIDRDITKFVLHEKELVEAKNKALESDRLKTAFLMNLSHEIRTPMNGILGFLSILKEPDLKDEERVSYTALVNKSGERLLNTIHDIIEISKIEAGDINVIYRTVDIIELMQHCFNSFKMQADERDLKFVISNQIKGEEFLIKSDKYKLESILMNLLKNAIKFTSHGSIELGNYIENERLYFYVSDTGIGIPIDKTDVIFDRFVQADISHSRNYEGSGVGLSIVKAYIDALKGEIKVESKVGEGSTFTFYIPHVPIEKDSDKMTDTPVTNIVNETRPTVLIAEDDGLNYEYLKTILRKEFTILHAWSGEESVELCTTNPDISVILMDIRMNGKYDGLEATRKIRQVNQDIAIIAQTAYALEEDKLAAINAGCNEYVSKPYDPEQLVFLVRKYCAARSKG